MSKIIGKCLGEYIKEDDVFYDPLTDTYKIKAGEKIMEIPGYALQSESIRTLQDALSNVDDENIKTDLVGSWAKARSNPDTSSIYTAKEISEKMQEAVTGLKQHPRLIDDDLDAKYRKIYLGDWGPSVSGEAKTALEIAAETEAKARARAGKTSAAGASFDSQAFDPLRVRVEAGGYSLDGRCSAPSAARTAVYDASGYAAQDIALTEAAQKVTGDKTYGDAARKLRANSVYGSSLGSAQAHTSAPWDDPLTTVLANDKNTVACMDMPEYSPDYNPSAQTKVYYHDRYPSIPIRSIIDDAIELLNKNKNLHISKISFSQSHPRFYLTISSLFPTNVVLRKTLEMVINHEAFDRAYKTELDEYAGLKARLDTNTYIKLRIAFLLYEAIKLRDEDARKISLDIFRIIGSNTRPDFTI